MGLGSRGERADAASFAAVVAPFLLLAGCSLPPLTGLHPAPPPEQRTGHYSEVGTASWYGPGFLGGRTSSGQIYNIGDMTAAHQTLPLGTRVVVTNLDNSRSVEVRVNDRGPFAKGRILDLSYAAARELGLVGPGTARVRVESVDEGDGPLGVVAYAVQAGAFQDGTKAFALRQTLAGRFDKVYLSPLRTDEALYYRVRVGPFEHREQAVTFAQQLARGGVPAMIVEEVSR